MPLPRSPPLNLLTGNPHVREQSHSRKYPETAENRRPNRNLNTHAHRPAVTRPEAETTHVSTADQGYTERPPVQCKGTRLTPIPHGRALETPRCGSVSLKCPEQGPGGGKVGAAWGWGTALRADALQVQQPSPSGTRVKAHRVSCMFYHNF